MLSLAQGCRYMDTQFKVGIRAAGMRLGWALVEPVNPGGAQVSRRWAVGWADTADLPQLRSGERIKLIPLLCIVCTSVVWGFALFFFFQGLSTWQVSSYLQAWSKLTHGEFSTLDQAFPHDLSLKPSDTQYASMKI